MSAAELADLTTGLKKALSSDSALGNTVKFSLDGAGTIFVDGTGDGNIISNDDSDADCTISMTLEDFQSIVAGSLDLSSTFMHGKLKVEGDMGIAMKLQPLLSSLAG